MSSKKKRILIVDDNPSIHDDFRRVLVPKPAIEISSEVQELENDLFDEPSIDKAPVSPYQDYQVDDAYQGDEAILMVETAEKEGFPYSLIFMDVRMPPGIDGIQTTSRIWSQHKNIEVVICTAYSDYSWDQIVNELGSTSHLLFLKKPFDTITVRQMALSLTSKWDQERKNENNLQQLENEVKKRTSQLENMIANLEKIREQSEKSIYSKSVFLSNISHEIKSPLNGILGMTDLLLNTDLNEEQKDFTQSIKSASDSLILLLNNVLDFSKIEIGKTTLFNIDFYLRTAIENVVDLVALQCAEKKLGLVIQTHVNVPDALIGDAHKIRQVFLNLCTNAVQQSNQGEVSVNIHLNENKSTEDTVNLQFEIQDSGDGYSPDELKELFSEGEAVMETSSGKHGDNQLRYSISRELIKMMGGEIGIESAKDKGTTVWFSSTFKFKKPSPFYFTSRNNTLSGINCLLLGDNPTSRKVICLHVSKWGGYCSESSTKENAVDKLQTSLGIKPFDVVIVDLKSGNIEDYTDISDHIKKFANLKHLNIVCLISSAKRGDTEILEQHGYSGFLTKPIKHSHLFYCLLMIREMAKSDNTQDQSKIITKYLIDEFAPDRYRFLISGTSPLTCKNITRILNQLKINCDVSYEPLHTYQAVLNRKYDAILIEDQFEKNGLDTAIKKIKESRKNENSKLFVINDLPDNTKTNYENHPEIAGVFKAPFSFENIDLKLSETFKGES